MKAIQLHLSLIWLVAGMSVSLHTARSQEPPTVAGAAQRLTNGWDRYVQRNALRPHLPAEIVNRIHKSVWTDCFLKSFTSIPNDRMQAFINQSDHPLNAYVDFKQLRRIWARNSSGKSRDKDIIQLWTAITLGLWLESTNNP